MPDILDQYGRPFDRAVLTEPQTAQLGYLRTEMANHPSRGLTPAKLAGILEQAERGDLVRQAELFEDMEEKDGHILAEMSKRKRAILDLDWFIEPPRNASAAEKKEAEALQEMIADLPDFEEVQIDLLDAIGKGYACSEIEWHVLGGQQLPNKITLRPASWFKTNSFAQDELRLRDPSAFGAELQPFGWIKHVHRAKSGYIGRAGLHRVLAWPYLFKNYSVRDMAEFLEIHGLPIRVGKYPSGASKEEKATLLRAVVNMGHNAAGIIPDSMMVEIIKATEGGAVPYDSMISWCERTQSKAILGSTLTSQADGKSSTNALGKVHEEVRQDLKKSDARQLAGTLSRDVVYPLKALNFGGADDPRRLPRFRYRTEEAEDIEKLADSVPVLVGAGVRIPVNWVNEQLQIPVPQDGEEILKPVAGVSLPKPGKPPIADLRTRARGLFAYLRGETAAADEFDRFADDLASDWQVSMGEIVNPVVRLAQSAKDYDEFNAGLAKLAGELEPGEFAEQLAEATFMGRVYGQAGKA